MTPTRQDDCLDLLDQVMRIISTADAPQTILQQTLRCVCRTADWALGHAAMDVHTAPHLPADVWHVAPDSPSTNVNAFRQALKAQRHNQQSNLAEHVFDNGQLQWIDDFDCADPHTPVAAACIAGLAAGCAVPISTPQQIIGVLEFYTHQPRPRDAALIEVMTQIGTNLGNAFERHLQDASGSGPPSWRIIDNAGEAFVGMDASGCITQWNRAAAAMFGWSRSEVLGQRVADMIIPPRYREAHTDGIHRYLTTGTSRVLGKPRKVHGLNRQGREFPIEITRWHLQHDNDNLFYAFIRDITEREQYEAQLVQHASREFELQQQALHDKLTELPNRRLLMERLEQLLARRDEHLGRLAVLCVDLDNFKRNNAYFGHAVGNQILAAVAEKLRFAVRPADLVAHDNGDEFVIVCPNIPSYRDAASIAIRILVSIKQRLHIQNYNIPLSASIGIAFADANSSGQYLLNAADTAMYRAKSAGGGQFAFFDEQMRLVADSRMRIESDLHDALARDQLRLYYQPIVSAVDETLTGVEALIRWQHPEYGLLTPDEFIPVAEDSKLIVPIGTWVFEQAYRDARELAAKHSRQHPLQISINLSAVQLEHADLVNTVRRIQQAAVLDSIPVVLRLEVTETVAMHDPNTSAAILWQLRKLGATIALDDFGIGYSSLTYLRRFPVDYIKLDKSFVKDMTTDPVAHAIVRCITDLAHALQLKVVAEGVETREQVQALRQTEVDLLQGFLYAKPAPLAEFLRMAWFT